MIRKLFTCDICSEEHIEERKDTTFVFYIDFSAVPLCSDYEKKALGRKTVCENCYIDKIEKGNLFR